MDFEYLAILWDHCGELEEIDPHAFLIKYLRVIRAATGVNLLDAHGKSLSDEEKMELVRATKMRVRQIRNLPLRLPSQFPH
jgi:hypothetical protein